VTVQLSSSDPTKVLLAPNLTTAGTGTITLPIAAGFSSISFVVQGVEGATPLPATVILTATATGYTDGTGTATVVPAGLQLVSLPSTTTTLSPDSVFVVRVGIPNAPTNSRVVPQ
jgi:hypothetical protein